MKESDIKYKLDKYRSGGANRFACPHCGRKRCFTRYVDVETGKYIGEECGICDHTASCGFHYPPREYFRDHPWLSPAANHLPVMLNGNPLLLSGNHSRMVLPPQSVEQTEFFDLRWAESSMTRISTFSLWFDGLPFEHEVIEQVKADYYLGGTLKPVILDHVNYGPAAIFWQIDEQQRVHDAKMIAYQTDGHRVQGWANTARSACEKSGIGPQLKETEKILFGQHLLPRYPDKVVCIVESEKSALICACRYPAYLWLATGGCCNLQPQKLRPLMSRRLMVYPDSGEYEKWSAMMQKSGHKNYLVVDYVEPYEPNTDIADIVLGVAKLKNSYGQR